MNQLWSPWRMKYIQNHESSNGCIFCEALQLEDGPENLIIYRGTRSFVILNLFPYTNAHLMVVPFDHQPSIEDLQPETRAELIELVTQAMQVIRAEYHPEAFNLGANIGAAAGAGVFEHVHIHVVPRWAGDTNFMSTVAGTRVLPEDLSITYQRMANRWRETLKK
jgi:ATP adenylyltransferase